MKTQQAEGTMLLANIYRVKKIKFGNGLVIAIKEKQET